jgi:rare lipoprotein A
MSAKRETCLAVLANSTLLIAALIGYQCSAETREGGAVDTSHAQAVATASPTSGTASSDKSADSSDKPKPPLDRSGKKRIGKASFYAKRFGGRKMADGNRMSLKDNNAASKTLPLGTTAKVTNLETGQSAVVTIQDRGPYVDGRIVDLSPSTAQQIGITRKDGIAKVAVAPIAVPLPNGDVKLGEAAEDTTLARNDLRVKKAGAGSEWENSSAR